MILVTFHENRDTCVSVSVGILRHMLQNDGIEHYPPVCIRPPIGTPNIAPFQLDLRAQNYLPLVEIATLMKYPLFSTAPTHH